MDAADLDLGLEHITHDPGRAGIATPRAVAAATAIPWPAVHRPTSLRYIRGKEPPDTAPLTHMTC